VEEFKKITGTNLKNVRTSKYSFVCSQSNKISEKEKNEEAADLPLVEGEAKEDCANHTSDLNNCNTMCNDKKRRKNKDIIQKREDRSKCVFKICGYCTVNNNIKIKYISPHSHKPVEAVKQKVNSIRRNAKLPLHFIAGLIKKIFLFSLCRTGKPDIEFIINEELEHYHQWKGGYSLPEIQSLKGKIKPKFHDFAYFFSAKSIEAISIYFSKYYINRSGYSVSNSINNSNINVSTNTNRVGELIGEKFYLAELECKSKKDKEEELLNKKVGDYKKQYQKFQPTVYDFRAEDYSKIQRDVYCMMLYIARKKTACYFREDSIYIMDKVLESMKAEGMVKNPDSFLEKLEEEDQ